MADVQILNGLTADALNALLIGPIDVSAFKWIQLFIGSDAYSGVLMPQVSFDKITWINISMFPMVSANAGDVSSSGFNSVTNVIYGYPVIAPFFQVIMSSYTSGGATGVVQLYPDGLLGFQFLETYVRIATNTGKEKIGLTSNDGLQTTPIAAGHSADTAIAVSGGLLARALVTTVGTNQMMIYDNASAASGTIIGIIPASSPVNGIPLEFKMPTQNGIFVKGDANNPAVTISYE